MAILKVSALCIFVSCLMVPMVQAKTIQNTFERKGFRYHPNKIDQARKFAVVKDGALYITVKPGTYSSSSDSASTTERVEVAQKTPGKFIVNKFRFRVPKGFKATRRTLIGQIKADDRGGYSPAAAIYLDKGGQVKCVDYNGALTKADKSKLSQNVRRVPRSVANLLDGRWHSVEMRLKRSETSGYCAIIIDGKLATQQSGHDSQEIDSKKYVARIGIYRDVLPYDQTVIFDDWVVKSNNKPLW